MIDGRLLAPASAAWLASAGTLLLLERLPMSSDRAAWSARALLAFLAVSAAYAVLALALHRRLPRGVLVFVAGLLLGASVAAMHVHSLSPDPVAGWLDARVTATVQGVVTGEPIVRTQSRAAVWQQPSHLEVRLATGRVSARIQRFEEGDLRGFIWAEAPVGSAPTPSKTPLEHAVPRF